MANVQFDPHSAVASAEPSWSNVAPVVFVPTNQQEFERLTVILDELAQRVQGDEAHPLANLLYVVATLVEQYEQEHDLSYEIPERKNEFNEESQELQ